MTAIATRLVAFAGPTADPLDPADPQLALVQGRVGVNLDPTIVKNGPAPLEGATDFWDVLVGPRFDKTPYVVLYECELQDTGEFVVKRDLFGPGDYPHSWLGWPIPGDETMPPSNDPVPLTVMLTEGEKKALAHVHKSKRR